MQGFTCSEIVLQSGISTFTEVQDLITSTTAVIASEFTSFHYIILSTSCHKGQVMIIFSSMWESESDTHSSGSRKCAERPP